MQVVLMHTANDELSPLQRVCVAQHLQSHTLPFTRGVSVDAFLSVRPGLAEVVANPGVLDDL